MGRIRTETGQGEVFRPKLAFGHVRNRKRALGHPGAKYVADSNGQEGWST